MHRIVLLILISAPFQTIGQFLPVYGYTNKVHFDSLIVMGYDSGNAVKIFEGRRGSDLLFEKVNGLPALSLNIGGYEKLTIIPDSITITMGVNGSTIVGNTEFAKDYNALYSINLSKVNGLSIIASEMNDNIQNVKGYKFYNPDINEGFKFFAKVEIDKKFIEFDSFRHFKNDDIPMMQREKAKIKFYVRKKQHYVDIKIGSALDLKEVIINEIIYKYTTDGFMDLIIKSIIGNRTVYVIRKGKNLHGNYGVFINEGEDWYSYSLYNE